MKRDNSNLFWQEIVWVRPFSQSDVLELLGHIASLSPRKNVVWEVRGSNGKVRHFLGTNRRYFKPLKSAVLAHGEIDFFDVKSRKNMTFCKQLKISKPMLALKIENTLCVLKTALSALANTLEGETLTLQIVLGESFSPSILPENYPNPHASFLDNFCGKNTKTDKETLISLKNKAVQNGFFSLIRIGANAETTAKSNDLLLGLMSAFRQFETAGVNFNFANISPENLNEVKIPLFLPLRLSVAEMAGFLLLPCTDAELAGVESLHPKPLRPPFWLENSDRNFAESLGVVPKKLSIPIKDSLEHTVILGATGSGKSTVMLNLILADIKAGRGVLVIDPKNDLVFDILARVPKTRAKDVVVIDPSDAVPVGLNPFILGQSPDIISDTVLAVFKQIFKDSWGVYSQDILSAALLTLAKTKNSTLLDLPKLLTDDNFRRKITQKIDDPEGLNPFWANFETMSKQEKRQVISPVMNKLRQFTLRPALRNILGQPHPKFSLSDLFEKNKIVLVALNKGVTGAETARLLGSLVVGLTWTLALSRAKIPAEKRNPVSIFVDELQDYLALPTDFSDALAQARGLGVGFTMAHQYRSQLSSEVKSAIDTNARNKIIFNLNVADAREMSAMSSELSALDFMNLPRFQIYATLQNHGKSTNWISGKTLSAPPILRLPAELKAESMERYGIELEEKTQEKISEKVSQLPTILTAIGRKKIN